jgi:SAM-dependent methyltransferase
LRKDLHEANRFSWNEATLAQNSHRGDQMLFFQQGGSTLYPEELELLGDIRGCSLAHLQCNVGQDSLSLAQMGAHVTGIDISDTAIAIAQNLVSATGIHVQFYRMDIYDWFEQAVDNAQQFDLVFCSYGIICWLSDLAKWARGIAAVLRPEGRFFIVDYHPMMQVFNKDQQRVFSYGTEGGEVRGMTWDNGVSDFVAQTGTGLIGPPSVEGVKDFQNPHQSHEFFWGLGQIVTALVNARLVLMTLREYPYANGYKRFYQMRQDGYRWYLPEDQPAMPMMYSIIAQKPKDTSLPLAIS